MYRFAAIIAAIFILSAAFSRELNAGEIGRGFGGCDLSSLFGCEWKPKSCYKPRKPFTFVSSVSSYNLAVAEFNAYVDSIADYRQCIIDEGKRDIEKRFPDIVLKGAEDEFAEAERDVRDSRQELELARSRIR